MEEIKLTPKQRLFCEEYLIDLNATRAAIRAGYSEKTAATIGNENMRKPLIKAYINKAMNSKLESTIATQEEVLETLTAILRGELNGTALKGVGMGAQEVVQVAPTVSERKAAADLLGKRYSLWTEKHDVNVTGAVTFVDDIGDDEE